MARLLGTSFLIFSIIVSAQSYTPRYANSDCPFFIRRLAEDSDADISCGYLIVPEDREASENGRLIALFVVRIAARHPSGNAPLIFLTGGPGSAVAERLPFILGSQLRQNYEVIAVDQRGAGFSRPSLNCVELDDQTRTSYSDWRQDCYRRLLDEGIALHSYNSANNAKDIHDLLVALDIEEANIYGLSYGSRLALTVARDFPERLRALILDGVLPLQVKRLETHALNGYQAIEQLFADCSADRICNRAYPNLRESFYSALKTMDREPAEIDQGDKDYPIVITGDDLVNEIYAKLYDAHLIPFLPALIDAYAQGDYDYDPAEEARRREAQTLIGAEMLWNLDKSSEGLALSVACAEEVPFNSRDEIVNRAANLPGAVRRPLVEIAISDISNCSEWQVPRAPDLENQPVASDIPTLLLSGRYDPVTPPEWGAEAAQYLVNSWRYVFPDSGHGLLFRVDAGCAESIALSFLANPERRPNDACIAELTSPDFYIRP